ncbi:receptor tyrosine-protein kinase erbB-3 precursor-like [Scleropages formosus]|uniref:Receptor protein-tyrosine kinase n=1 Tax=Scleropages formosus TaxID=113540 RepID=A0A0P7YSH1_SCLFO|nr:receptor tyrosine-protein kinase erbB-3 precursor-like [Scleropages formosus]
MHPAALRLDFTTKADRSRFAIIIYPVKGQQVAICTGTQNSLSTSGGSEEQYNITKKLYSGCEIVMGNLEITHMEQSRDFSFLQSIREVTGYILIAINEFSYLPLEQLRVIRGTNLYEGRFALAIFVNYKMDGPQGLQELGFTHLTEILRGGVQIIRNKYLKYAPRVNWADIVQDSSADIIIEENGIDVKCDPACQGHCWGPGKDKCQTLTKTICAPQCNGRCFGTQPSDCCHVECAGGCTGPHNTDCFACSQFNDSGACVLHCPETLIYNKHTFQLEPNPNAKYQYGSICVSQCPTNFVVDGSSCVSSCPSDKKEVEKNGVKKCEPCEGLCPKACKGTGSSNRQTVNSENIDSFINCTKIQGSLHFLTTGITGKLQASYVIVTLTCLPTEILSIQSWPKEFTDLSVFSNLTTIQGRSLYKGFSLLVTKLPFITSLGLRSLRNINDGSVYISNNKRLCYHYTVNWTQLFTGTSSRQQDISDIKKNRPESKCIAEGRVCDPLCSTSGCWGPGPDQCLSCRNYSRGGTCVAQCNFITGVWQQINIVISVLGNPTGNHESLQGRSVSVWLVTQSARSLMEWSAALGRNLSLLAHSLPTTGIVVGVLVGVFLVFAIFVLGMLHHRGRAIRRKRAMRRYLESGETFEPLEPGEKGTKVHARILKVSELRKIKVLGTGIFGTVHKGVWIPEGDTIKIPVAIKTIQDRTGRQTFTEITDTNSNQADVPTDEQHHNKHELEDLDAEIENQEEEDLDDAIATSSLYLPPTWSHSRLRIDSHRSINAHCGQAGYLPMTPGAGDNPRQLRQPRSRLNSARTVSESSEGRGTLLEPEVEPSEDSSLTGSLRRGRCRTDSAYMSGAPETPSPHSEGEEDHNGYVLPGISDSPEREGFSALRNTLPYVRGCKRAASLLESAGDGECGSEEYEYMNKQTCLFSSSTNQLEDGSQRSKRSLSPIGSTGFSPGEGDTEQSCRKWMASGGNTTEALRMSASEREATGGHGDNRSPMKGNRRWKGEVSGADISDSGTEQPPGRESENVEYQYMDICDAGAARSPTLGAVLKRSSSIAAGESGQGLGVESKREEEDLKASEEEEYQYMNQQPRLSRTLQMRDSRDLDGYEYEEMGSVRMKGDQVEYQNVKMNTGGEAGSGDIRRSELAGYLKVSEPGRDRSFNNPSYWHSRMFVKPDAVRT